MKKLLLALLFFPLFGNAQSAQRWYTALFPNPQGENYVAVIPNASVYVCQYNVDVQCTTQIGIYSDKQLNTPIVQPLLADGNGVYSYYIQSGTQVVEKVCAPYDQCTNYVVMIGDDLAGLPGGGTVTSVSCGNLSPIFGCSVTNPTTTPAIGFTLDNAQSFGFLGNVANTTGPPSYVTLVAGANVTLTANTISNPNTLTIAATGGGTGCLLGGLGDTWVLSVHPVGTCYGSTHFTWDDATGNENLILGDGTTLANFIQESYQIGNFNSITGKSFVDSELFSLGFQNFISDTTTTGIANDITQAYLIGDGNSVTASGASPNTPGIGDVFLLGVQNSITSTTSGVSVAVLIGGGNLLVDTLAADDDIEMVGNDNYVNGALSTVQIFGHLNQAVNVSYDNPLDVDQTIFGAQNLAQHTGGGTYADYFDVFGHGNYEHDCFDCIAIGAGVEVATNNLMGIGESRIPELRFTSSNVQRTPLNMALPAPINTAIGLNRLPVGVTGTCTLNFTGGTGSGGQGQVYVEGYVKNINHYYIQITNGGSYSVAPTGASLTGGGACTGTINVHATLLTVQACSAGLEGSYASIADSTTNIIGQTITGGGSNHVFGYCDGTNWLVAASKGPAATVGSAEVVSFSATPTFSTSFNVSRVVLTGNITSFTLGAATDGQSKTLCFKQGSGPFTVSAPANVHGFFTIGTTNADWNCQAFVYDNTDSIWLAAGPGTINQ